jgi:hypothetical protein
MKHPCADCPFNPTGAGAHLRRSLRPGRMREIKSSLLDGATFPCHKTTDETGNGTNLLCAGSLAFQNAHGIVSQLQQVMERLEWMRNHKEAR